MKKTRITTNIFLPMPVVIVGTEIRGRPNFLTAGWVSRVNTDPPMIAVSISRANATPKGIQENGAFSINLPTAAMVKETDYCGLVSCRYTDKSNIFDHFQGTLTGAPMILNCPLVMECRLVDTMELPTHLLFIGEIIGGYASEGALSGGRPDMRSIKPLFLTMPDNHYWALGRCVGKAWSEGTHLADDG
jgi:flavin reductase (DIM6/NTAB) family NADH-FMN oxidoreductase RutF